MRGRGARLTAAAVGWLALVSAPAADEGALYEWTDETGVVRYTPRLDRVPRDARETMRVVVPEEPEPHAETNGSPIMPGALPAVMGSKLPGEFSGSRKDPPEDPEELAQRIAELREAIALDEEALRELVAAAQDPTAVPDPRLEAIANRLPLMQAELSRLEEAQRERPADPLQP